MCWRNVGDSMLDGVGDVGGQYVRLVWRCVWDSGWDWFGNLLRESRWVWFGGVLGIGVGTGLEIC